MTNLALPLVSSVLVISQGAHWVVRVWNRGGLAGELIVDTSADAEAIAHRLIPNAVVRSIDGRLDLFQRLEVVE